MSVLLLNASYEPLRVVPLSRAMKMVVAGRAVLVAEDPSAEVRSGGGAIFPMPTVIRLLHMVVIPHKDRALPLTRRNLVARDGGTCQVSECDRAGTTVDHVVPRSRGGEHTWRNVVLMCAYHNHRKGSRLLSELGWTLKTKPATPRAAIRLLADARIAEAKPEWSTYLAWAS